MRRNDRRSGNAAPHSRRSISRPKACLSGVYDVVIAGGIGASAASRWARTCCPAPTHWPGIARRYPDGLVPQGISAELIAAKWGSATANRTNSRSPVTRRRRASCRSEPFTQRDRCPSPSPYRDRRRPRRRSRRRHPPQQQRRCPCRPPLLHSRAPLRRARFPQIGWSVTRGNSSQINDGAAALLIMSSEHAARSGHAQGRACTPSSWPADDPLTMLTAIIPATARACTHGLSIADIDLFEVDEAFASVVLARQRETGATSTRST